MSMWYAVFEISLQPARKIGHSQCFKTGNLALFLRVFTLNLVRSGKPWFDRSTHQQKLHLAVASCDDPLDPCGTVTSVPDTHGSVVLGSRRRIPSKLSKGGAAIIVVQILLGVPWPCVPAASDARLGVETQANRG